VEGYAYTNAVDREDEVAAVVESMPQTEVSLHYVFDRTHTFGGLILLRRPGGITDEQLVDGLADYLTAVGVDPAAEVTVDDVLMVGDLDVGQLSVDTEGGRLTIYAWNWPDGTTAGWFLTTRPDLGTPFVTELVGAAA
jgi:hypothetical protein